MKVLEVVQAIAEVIDLGNGQRLTASQFLQHFLFTPEKQHNYVHKLSGGERRRLYLCTVLITNPNFLVLDEPTNDLDILTLNILEEYLQAFSGCLIVVSHDRFFMDKVTDHLLVFHGNARIQDFPGNYTQYREWKQQEEKKEAAEVKSSRTEMEPRRIRTEEKAKLTFKEKREFEGLEQEIEQLEAEKEQISGLLSSGTLTSEELTERSTRLSQVMELIDAKTMRWLELSEKTI
jgi:ATP-binding cassette subfamily F protein uup